MAALLRAGQAPADLMATYASAGRPTRPQRPLPLRQRPQMEALPRRSPIPRHSHLRPRVSSGVPLRIREYHQGSSRLFPSTGAILGPLGAVIALQAEGL